jgi:hypothetical protein
MQSDILYKCETFIRFYKIVKIMLILSKKSFNYLPILAKEAQNIHKAMIKGVSTPGMYKKK